MTHGGYVDDERPPLFTSTAYGYGVAAASIVAFKLIHIAIGRTVEPPVACRSELGHWKWLNIVVSWIHSTAIGIACSYGSVYIFKWHGMQVQIFILHSLIYTDQSNNYRPIQTTPAASIYALLYLGLFVYITFCIIITRYEESIRYLSIHGGRLVSALACNARGDGFAPHLRRYFRDLIQSPARRDLKWSVGHYRKRL